MVEELQQRHDVARLRLLQVYRYLEALNQLRNPVVRQIEYQPWTLWFRDLPNHPTIVRGGTRAVSDGTAVGPDAPSTDDFILKVQRPTLTRAPEPTAEIRFWLRDGWQQVDGKVEVYRTRRVKNHAGESEEVRFEDDVDRPLKLKEWIATRNRWADTERSARSTMAIFDKLYALQAHIERESERLELVLGDGLLDWPYSGVDKVHHPVLLQRLTLRFDPSIPEFRFVEADQPPELYTALFRSISTINAAAIGRCRTDLEQNAWHPLGADETSAFLKRLATQLSPHGEFTGDAPPKGERDAPRIGRDLVVFLRSRTLGFATAIEAILSNLPDRQDMPAWMANIVGIETQQREGATEREPIPTGIDYFAEDEDILLTKEANAEQLQIARRLNKHGAVLVQGPPGTGKTHSIANLIGHLLAQGKSILVTSHAEKALKVLGGQVVESLQPLCVSVLSDSRDQMESAVDAISERLSSSDADALEREAGMLAKQRSKLLSEICELRQRLQYARQDEYRPVVVAGESFSPSDAARRVHKGAETDSWIPTPITLDVPLPLSESELIDLYLTNVKVSPDDEKELSSTLPDPQDILTPTEFEELVIERDSLLEEDLTYESELWSNIPDDQTPETLDSLLAHVRRAIQPLTAGTGWQLATIAAGREGGSHRAVWEKLLAQVEDVCAEASEAQELLLKFSPSVPHDCLPDSIENVVQEICEHMQAGGKLRWLTFAMHSEWKTFVNATRVNQKPPTLPEHFEALRTMIHLQSSRAALKNRWQAQMASLGGPPAQEIGPEPEKACRQFAAPIRECLDWYSSVWKPLEEQMTRAGLNWSAVLAEIPPNLTLHGDLLRLRDAVSEKLSLIVQAQKNRSLWAHNEAMMRELTRKLEMYLSGASVAEIVQRLHEAVKRYAIKAYREGYERLVALYGERKDLARRHELLAKLDQAAPAWAAAIRNRHASHGGDQMPGSPADAWMWRQLHDELERRGQVSLEELERRVGQLGGELRNTTARLTERKAWLAQMRRTSLAQRQALRGWKALMRKVGRRTGIRAPKLLAEARKLIPLCQSAVPVWIMPLSRVVENFDPHNNRFDVVIIDEASQADVMAMTALYLGREIIVVGDHEQVSPLAISQRHEEVQHLIDEYLEGIPNANLYDGQTSIYDLAMTAFEGLICLREHFRCVPPIIQFSNYLSYDGKIKPLRDASMVTRQPHTIAFRVDEAGVNARRINEKEAHVVASLLVACTEQPEYADATFGVISLVGDEQADFIDMLLRRFLSPSEYIRRQLRCGNSASFQGDERDVMFLSVVDSPIGNGPLPLRREGAQNLFKKRFNVAASRARDQMWVVHSVDPDTDLQEADIRRRLIMHARDPEALERNMERQEAHVESEFERLVLRRLIQAGYRVLPQFKVGAYRIDLVVEGGGKRLAVECDGDRWHPPEKMDEDLARQAILERLGWRFVRIRGSQFFRDPNSAMEAVFARIDELGIPAEGVEEESERNESADVYQIKERILRRAVELRDLWEAIGDDAFVQAGRKTAPSGGDSRRPMNTSGVEIIGKSLKTVPAQGADEQPATEPIKAEERLGLPEPIEKEV